MQVGQHGVLQRYPGLLLQRLEGLRVVMLAEVLEAKADGFLLSVLRGVEWVNGDGGGGGADTGRSGSNQATLNDRSVYARVVNLSCTTVPKAMVYKILYCHIFMSAADFGKRSQDVVPQIILHCQKLQKFFFFFFLIPKTK